MLSIDSLLNSKSEQSTKSIIPEEQQQEKPFYLHKHIIIKLKN
jgi:hypothetical protein